MKTVKRPLSERGGLAASDSRPVKAVKRPLLSSAILAILLACTPMKDQPVPDGDELRRAAKTVPEQKPFGTPEDLRYAAELWQVMAEKGLTSAEAEHPYPGIHPHGAVLETVDTTATVEGHTGRLIVKKNYVGEGVTVEKVKERPNRYLGAITVMFKREAGYDPENRDWFWVKFLPDGTVAKNPKGVALAGRVAKGMPRGCIACHKQAPGGDYLYRF